MSSAQPQYEFTQDQNQLIGGLAGKMKFVGLFMVLLGVINLVTALATVGAVYRDRIPADWKAKTQEYLEKAKEQLPADMKKSADDYSLDKLPTNDHLWGIAINAGIIGLFYLLMGSWTRTAGASFQKIVQEQGRDITHLMNGLGALHKMYTLIYTLLVITLLIGVIAMALTLYNSFTA